MPRPLIDVHHALNRRQFLRVAGAVGAGAVLLAGCSSDDGSPGPTSTPGAAEDPPPETTTIRLGKTTVQPRMAPLYLAEQFLPAEGFTNVQYVDVEFDAGGFEHIAAGEIDIGLPYASSVTAAADAGDQLVVLAGVHNTFLELFGNDRVQSLRDLKGKRIAVVKRVATNPAYSFMAALLAYVGIDVEHEVEFVEVSPTDYPTQALAGTFDAWITIRPSSTLIYRNANIGHVVLDGTVDPPWSQYFGGMATANRGFVEQHPAATKRALRAILKATDLCARQPERAARYLVDRGFTLYSYDETLDSIPVLSYAAWREFDPEDTMRFYALRLQEAGLVKTTPDELIARATDWRYLDELKVELGA